MAYILSGAVSGLSSWIRAEVEFTGPIQKGKRGIAARRVQEWLCLHDHRVVIDSDFGDITESAVKEFQRSLGRPQTGIVNQITWDALVAPMLTALQGPANPGPTLRRSLVECGDCHLAVHPREVGGQNRGPWVRLYMFGNEGADWPWCAGFVTFLMNQASELTGIAKPIQGSVSCDSLAEQAKAAGIFVPQGSLQPGMPGPGAIFLRRRTSTDWTHTGIVTESNPQYFFTVEGNTNDEGDREGYEVCSRRQGYVGRDFILI